MKQTLLLTRTLPPVLEEALGQFGTVITLSEATSSQKESAQVLVSTAVDQVDSALMDDCGSNLALIANIGVGTDNIDLGAAKAKNIAVANTPVVTEDTADLAWALILAASRRLTACEAALREGMWAKGATTLGHRVHGKTLGIIGLGSIGVAVARRATGFGMRIVYTGPNLKPDLEIELNAEFISDLNKFMQEVDIVSLHCPLTVESQHLLGEEQFAHSKPGQVLVNTGRGPLVDEQALIQALQSKKLAAAGLDVFEFEPEVSAELLSLDNVTTLPHIGSATNECRSDMALCTVRNVHAFLTTGKPEHGVI